MKADQGHYLFHYVSDWSKEQKNVGKVCKIQPTVWGHGVSNSTLLIKQVSTQNII